MSRISSDGDPRDLGGDISGWGGPLDRNAVVVNTERSVLLEEVECAIAHNTSDGRGAVVILLAGRINRSTDRARVLYLADADGVAALVTERESLMRRAGDPWLDDYREQRASRIVKLKAEGLW
jgi:hypothetical protein